MAQFCGLVLLGLVVGLYGTLVGAGGGFLLVPILLLIYRSSPPEVITAVSLPVVFFNAGSGSIAYARMGRVDFRAGLIFGAMAVPGALIGAATTRFFSSQAFDWVLGPLLVLIGGYLVLRPISPEEDVDEPAPMHPAVENGRRPTYVSELRLGAILSLLVGFISSILGIGGGIIHVPILSRLLRFPVHVATATSHFVLAITALAGTAVHLVDGDLAGQFLKTAALAIGVVPGAQIGALVSTRLHGAAIIRGLALGLVLVGIRVAVLATQS